MWVSRDWMVIGPSGATRSPSAMSTVTSANSGTNFESGSSSAAFPSSTRIITDTLVTGFVIEKMRRMSSGSSVSSLAPRSRSPTASQCTT